MSSILFSGTYNTVQKSKILLVAFVVVMILSGVESKIYAAENGRSGDGKLATVTLCIGENWEPYYSETLDNGGVVVELVRRAFTRGGYSLELEWFPWTRAFNMAKTGDCDGVLGAWYTEERKQFFIYSEPFLTTELVFFKRKGEKITYTTLRDLQPYRIGVARDSGPYELLKPEFEQNLDVATSAYLNIQKLMGKRFDLLADEKLNVLYIINTHLPEWRGALEILSPPLQINKLHVIISKKIETPQKIVDAFNHGLKEIQEDGTFDAILKEYNFSEIK
ncbi:substrate-binding periplasmic protein [Desulfopila aestuarii]|uniref:Polar amino acid transport system substrate-binding protein n=1 Tax=Desulfopila aestuarii DSM 18488 TaxID=1121416 RepID=A0A1M7Y6G2_9BACT|nr:transporter substrate-binding domain-containing protein [Desulfopila aestuarii]SHO48181.1 polar amino acid transport system substrate-binding protein [Desulfopila aestuarii DSM 18488]